MGCSIISINMHTLIAWMTLIMNACSDIVFFFVGHRGGPAL